jgi:hypothetical protein
VRVPDDRREATVAGGLNGDWPGSRSLGVCDDTKQMTSDHVRSENAAIVTLLQHASERSLIFPSLIDTINAASSRNVSLLGRGSLEH